MHNPGDKRGGVYSFWIALFLCISPLFGIFYLDLPLGPYLEFPPETRYVVHAPFSWSVFAVLLILVAAVIFPVAARVIQYKGNQGESGNRHVLQYPRWAWFGLALLAVFWVLAWNRFVFFRSLQRYTFTPLWLGYILAANGLSFKRKGTCFMIARRRFFLLLFPLSSFFWWYFEYLNRFVQNWYYIAGGNISRAEYIIHASIAFSTVLPAVLATYECLWTFGRPVRAFGNWYRLTFTGSWEAIGWLILSAAVFCMAFLVVVPDYLFPMVWISPLLIIVGVQLIAGYDTVFSGLLRGDWRSVVLAALAAIICGFFWELWNWKSLAHWQYSIPFVDRFHVFAMPVLGYAGYFPFGIACIAFIAMLHGPLEEDWEDALLHSTGEKIQ